MTPWHVGRKRLLRLAQHLENGKLGHKRFDFAVFNDGKKNKQGCGTHGCALGECPIIWPRLWEFRAGYVGSIVSLKHYPADSGCAESAVLFFGISRTEVQELFYPFYPRPWAKYESLPERVTRNQVAKSICQFVAWKDTQR